MFNGTLRSSLGTEKVKELKTTLKRQLSLFTKPVKKANAATEASFKMVHILTKHKKPFTNGRIVKDVMTAVAETLFKDHKSKTEIMSAIADNLVLILWQGECLHCLWMQWSS